MFKAIPYIVKLHMYKHVDHRVNRVAHFCQTNPRPQKPYSQVQERDPCQPPPDPCPPPPKDDRAFWGALAILFTMGCFGVYAKHTPELRDWLTIYANWFDDLIAIAYQENMTYAEHAKALKAAVLEILNPREPPKLCDSEGNLIKKPKKVKKPALTIAQQVCRSPDTKEKEEKTVKKCNEPPKPPTVKDVCEIQACLQDTGLTCLNNYWTAKEACRVYNELVEENLNVTNFTPAKLKDLRAAMCERFKLVNEHVCNAVHALHTLETLDRLVKKGADAPKELMDNTNDMIKEVMAKVKVMQAEYIWEADRAASMDEKWQNVEKLVNQYMKENQTLFPGTNYDSEKPSIQSGTDLLLLHTLKYRNWLEAVLNAGVQAASMRTDRGIETLSQDEKSLNQLIESEYKKKQAAMDQWYKQKLDWQKTVYDEDTKKALAELKERHEQQLAINLQEKEEEATKTLDKLVKEAVDEQKKQFALELRDMSLKVQDVENKLNARLKAEREAKRSQHLWAIGASIIAATKSGDPRICVARQIRALEAAASDGDKFMETVVKALPNHSRRQGLVPESVLRQRYYEMEKTARDVALVEQEGSPMPVYMLSWLQSRLLFMKPSGIPQEDIDNPEKTKKQLEDFDTFDRLNYARYWIEQGNLAHALRYVDSLEGASRVAADPWYKDAKSHLELKQVAEAVIAHATAMALQYV